MSAASPIRIGVAGLGYWGPNVARNLAALPGVELAWCCDASEATRARHAPDFPGLLEGLQRPLDRSRRRG